MQIRVYYEDTDCGNMVYHANYLNYCERARSEKFFRANFKLGEGNCHFVVKDISAHFLSPAKLGDLLEIKTQILNCKKASVVVHHEIFKDEIKLFWADITLAYICSGKIARIDKNIRKFLSCG